MSETAPTPPAPHEPLSRSARFDFIRPMFRVLRARGIDIQSPTRRAAANPAAVQRHIFAGCQVTTILDCGGHHGRVASEYAAAFPGATVYTFEPTPATFAVLRSRVAAEPRIRPINAAVGEIGGTADFFIAAHEQANSLLAPAPASTDPSAINRVSTTVHRIDEFCRGKDLERVEILKLDIEGFELPALRGCGRLLDEQRIDLIYLETRFDSYGGRYTTFPQLCEHLLPRGYEFFGVYDLRYRADLQFEWADAIFVSRKRLAEYRRGR